MKKIALLCVVFLLVSTSCVWAAADFPEVMLETNKGEITLELNRRAAPKTVENFLKYVESGFFDGTIFHRVIKGFMIQGGGLSVDMVKKKTRAPVENEADNGLNNLPGSIAMARTQDPHSATAQFFINTAANTFLNHKGKTSRGWGYCVFGRVVAGMDVVNAIETVPTGFSAGRRDVPTTPITITAARVITEKK